MRIKGVQPRPRRIIFHSVVARRSLWCQSALLCCGIHQWPRRQLGDDAVPRVRALAKASSKVVSNASSSAGTMVWPDAEARRLTSDEIGEDDDMAMRPPVGEMVGERLHDLEAVAAHPKAIDRHGFLVIPAWRSVTWVLEAQAEPPGMVANPQP